MIPVESNTIDPYWGGVDENTVLSQIEYYSDCREVCVKENTITELLKDFENKKVFISPYGTIGALDNDGYEFIFSITDGRFIKVRPGEGFSRDWGKCSKELFKKNIKLIFKNIHNRKINKKWNNSNKLQTEITIEKLDLLTDDIMTLYAIRNEKDMCKTRMYKLCNDSGKFEIIKKMDKKLEELHKCPVYKAYEIFNAVNYIDYSDILISPEKLNLFINNNEDIVGVAKEGVSFQYVLSYGNGEFILLKKQIYLDENVWKKCSLQEFIDKQNNIKQIVNSKPSVKFEDLDFYISEKEDIMGYAKDGKKYVLAPKEGTLFEVFPWELEELEWKKCTLEEAKAIQNVILQKVKEEERRIKEAEERDYGDGSWYVSVWEYKDSIKYSNDSYILNRNRNKATIERVTATSKSSL